MSKYLQRLGLQMFRRRSFLRSLLLVTGIGASESAAIGSGQPGDKTPLDHRERNARQLDGPEGSPSKLDAKSIKDALANDASPLLGLRYQEEGARVRKWAEVASKQIELSGLTGADKTGAADSYAAVQRGLQIATERRGELILDGGFRVSLNARAPIVITSPVAIRGAQPRLGNITSLRDQEAGLYFDQDAPSSIVVNNSQLTIEGCAIIGPARASRNAGIKTIGENSALRLCGGAVVQSWQIGLKYENGYYHRINDACIIDCMTGLQVSAPSSLPAIYNLVVHQLKIAAAAAVGSKAMSIFGGSQVSVAQSSFESFTDNGITVQDASLDLFSSYFEGSGGCNVRLLNRARVNAIGNRVYLNTGSNRWIAVEGEDAIETQIVSMGNQFTVPENGALAEIYAVSQNDPLAVTNIGEDIILNRAAMGPNVHYIAPRFFAGAGPATLRGSHNIRFPAGHPRQHAPVSTMPVALCPAQTAIGEVPAAPVVMSYQCSGSAGDDPGGWRTGGWGAHAMAMVFHRSSSVPEGQWEKVGLRLPHIAAPAGGSTVDAEARAALATLLAALNKQGVMPPS